MTENYANKCELHSNRAKFPILLLIILCGFIVFFFSL